MLTERIRYAWDACNLGQVLVACSPQGICAILLGDTVDPLVAEPKQRFRCATVERDTTAEPAHPAPTMRCIEHEVRHAADIASQAMHDGFAQRAAAVELLDVHVIERLSALGRGQTFSPRLRAVGVEIEPAYRTYAARCAAALQLEQVEFIQGDVHSASLAPGTVFFL